VGSSRGHCAVTEQTWSRNRVPLGSGRTVHRDTKEGFVVGAGNQETFYVQHKSLVSFWRTF